MLVKDVPLGHIFASPNYVSGVVHHYLRVSTTKYNAINLTSGYVGAHIDMDRKVEDLGPIGLRMEQSAEPSRDTKPERFTQSNPQEQFRLISKELEKHLGSFFSGMTTKKALDIGLSPVLRDLQVISQWLPNCWDRTK